MWHLLIRVVAVLWASPYTLLGLVLGTVGLLTGGRARLRLPTIEFHGGAVRSLLRRLPPRPGATALTLGHTVLGQTAAALDIARNHELVHVRQYEHWGPLMGPAYLLCCLLLWLGGQDAYRNNPFERQAFEETDNASR